MLIRDVYLANGERTAIRIGDDRIVAVDGTLTPLDGEDVIDGGGMAALPGAIDMHVHARTPGDEHKEDYAHLIPAALAGGVTAIAVMPNTHPPLDATQRIRNQIEAAAGVEPDFRMFVNAGVNRDDVSELKRCLELDSVRAIKLYEVATTGTSGQADDDIARRVFQTAEEYGVPVMVHAQDEAMIRENRKRFSGQRASDHYRIQSLDCELSAVNRYLRLVKDTGARLTICHVSSADALETIADWNAKHGKRVFSEVAPHYWRLNTTYLDRPDGTLFQMNPSLREPDQRARIEKMLLSDEFVDYIATDHAPHTLEEKHRPYGDAPSGIPGVQTALPLLWDTGRRQGMDLERFVRLTSARAAEIYGIPGGDIRPSAPADVILFDPNRRMTIRNSDQKSKCGWTPYDGLNVLGQVVMTILRGRIVFETAPFE